MLDRAVDKLTGGFPVPDEGVHQVLAVVVLTLVAEASDVEIGLGDAVADAERLVFSTARHRNPLEEIYDLKREIAEARRALSPVTSVLPELIAEAEEATGRRQLAAVAAPRRRRGSTAWTSTSTATTTCSATCSRCTCRRCRCGRTRTSARSRRGRPSRRRPRCVASIYGMNFEHMPELDWTYGYPLAIAAMARRLLLAVPRCSAGPAGSERYVVTGALFASSTPVSSRITTSAARPSR